MTGVLDFAMLPPEVNSGRMYAGTGVAPLTVATAAWDRLATTLSSAASSYRSVVSELADGPWRGPASTSMTAAADPYVGWMTDTAAQAERTANQARTAAAAYEQAFAATVPPPVIAANRVALATLVATNILGQNTPAIAANQAEYAEMWAQDASTMYTYASRSAAASVLTPFATPPQTTNPAGISAQATTAGSQNASAPLSILLHFLANPFQTLASSQLLNNPTIKSLGTTFQNFGGAFEDIASPDFINEAVMFDLFPFFGLAGKLAMFSPGAGGLPGAAGLAAVGAGLTSSVSEGATGLALTGSYGSGLGGVGASAALGKAAPIGVLSVPPSWDTATSEVRLASVTVPTAEATGLAPAGMVPPGGMFGGPVGSVVNAPRNTDPRVRSSSSFKAVPQIEREAGTDDGTENRWAQASDDAEGVLVGPEDVELVRLRERMAELAMECDAMSTLMTEAKR